MDAARQLDDGVPAQDPVELIGRGRRRLLTGSPALDVLAINFQQIDNSVSGLLSIYQFSGNRYFRIKKPRVPPAYRVARDEDRAARGGAATATDRHPRRAVSLRADAGNALGSASRRQQGGFQLPSARAAFPRAEEAARGVHGEVPPDEPPGRLRNVSGGPARPRRTRPARRTAPERRTRRDLSTRQGAGVDGQVRAGTRAHFGGSDDTAAGPRRCGSACRRFAW